ncbi:MAG: competence ComEA-like helix-hairpin-helix protein [Bacteroidia bacterium]|jgi:competence protein ComEA
MLPQWFKEYLSFHRSERRGIIILVFFLIALIAFNMCQRFFWEGDWEEIHLKYGPMIIQFQEETDSITKAAETPKNWTPKPKELFKFDPNILDSVGWVALGFSPKQAAAIIKYRNAGAEFRKPEDVKKLFVVDDERYKELKPFISIAELPKIEFKKKFDNKPKWEKPKYVPIIVELNNVDSATLVKVKGIGPFFARVIIEHREKLGGYRTKEQVLEVYGMDSAKYAGIENQLTVDSLLRTQINVNASTLKELVRHPYINFNQAKAIVNYRKQHGEYKQLEDLKKIHLINEESYVKMSPYLKAR